MCFAPLTLAGCSRASVSETLCGAMLLCVSVVCCFRILIIRFFTRGQIVESLAALRNVVVKWSWVWSLCLAFSSVVKQSMMQLQCTGLHRNVCTSILDLGPPPHGFLCSSLLRGTVRANSLSHVVWALSVWVFPCRTVGIPMNGRQEEVQGRGGGGCEYLKERFYTCTVNCWWLSWIYFFFIIIFISHPLGKP